MNHSANNQSVSESVNQIQNPKCRLSPAHRLNLAVAYAAKGDLETAEQHVAAAYAEKPDLKDGWARVGWTAFASKPEERIKSLPYLEKDFSANHLTVLLDNTKPIGYIA